VDELRARYLEHMQRVGARQVRDRARMPTMKYRDGFRCLACYEEIVGIHLAKHKGITMSSEAEINEVARWHPEIIPPREAGPVRVAMGGAQGLPQSDGGGQGRLTRHGRTSFHKVYA